MEDVNKKRSHAKAKMMQKRIVNALVAGLTTPGHRPGWSQC
jgi:hypothetical protein